MNNSLTGFGGKFFKKWKKNDLGRDKLDCQKLGAPLSLIEVVHRNKEKIN